MPNARASRSCIVTSLGGAATSYVIAGPKMGARLINLQKPWRRIRTKAKLDDLRIHDLRHSFASVAAGVGLSLPMIGTLLGHSQPATTARYAHLAMDPVRGASDLVAEEIAAVMSGVEPDQHRTGQRTKKPTGRRRRVRLT